MHLCSPAAEGGRMGSTLALTEHTKAMRVSVGTSNIYLSGSQLADYKLMAVVCLVDGLPFSKALRCRTEDGVDPQIRYG